MKKLVFFLAAILTAASLFATGGRQTASQTQQGPTPLTIAFWWYQQDYPNAPDDRIGAWVEEKFNVDIKIIVQDWGDYQQKFRLWAASNDLPDTFSGYCARETWFPEFIREGLIRSIPYSFISKFPNLKAYVDGDPASQDIKNYYGAYYYLPRLETTKPGIKLSTNTSIYYRKDWAEKAGITERPTDMDAFYNLLDAFVNKDPDGTGRKDTYGLSTSDLYMIYYPFGAFPDQWIINADGSVSPGFADEEPMVRALTWLRRAYSNGLIDPEFPTNSNERGAKFGQNTFGAIHYAIQPNALQQIKQQLTAANPGIDPMKAVDWIGGLSEKKGGVPYRIVQSEGGGMVFRDGLSDQLMEKYMEIQDYFLSEEGIFLATWGFKDIDYRVNPDGSYTKIEPKNIWDKYPSARTRSWSTWTADLDYTIDPNYTDEEKAWTWAWQQNVNAAAQNTMKKVNNLAVYVRPEERSLFDAEFDVNTKLLEIFTGTGDVRTMYRAFMNEANGRSLQNVVRSMNAALKK
jgi:ABC-type glycerol-3-phosphate transport system substrate-binding protein